MATASVPAPKSRGGARTSARVKAAERKPADCPDFTRPEVEALGILRARCRDLVGSDTASATDMMHHKSTVYLPKWEGEDDETYRLRSTLTELYGGLERCVVASRGLIMAKPPVLADNADPRLLEHWENIDGMGTHARVYLNDVLFDGLVDAIVANRIDFPVVAQTGLSIDDVARAKLRPRWIKVNADQIINWKVAMIDNEPTYTMLVLHEGVDEDDGLFGSTSVEQYRVMRLALVPVSDTALALRRQITFQIWRKRIVDDVVEWFVSEEGEIRGTRIIPVAIGYLNTASGPLVAKPPLAALADLNLGHYRVSADRRWLMSIVHAPTPVIEGWVPPRNPDGTSAPEEEMKMGPSRAMKLQGTAKFRWEQADPGGLTSSKEEKEDLLSQMAAMSIAFMSHEKRSQETATAHRINAMSQNASLAIAAAGMKDLIAASLAIHCQFMGIQTPPDVTLNTVYDEGVLDAQTIVALNALEKDANLTKGTLLSILQRGKVIPEDVDLEDEENLLVAEASARQQLQADILAASATNANGNTGDKTPAPPATRPARKKKRAPAPA